MLILKGLKTLDYPMHNSNKPIVHNTLFGEIIPEYKYYILGFVNGEYLLIKRKYGYASIL